MNETLRPMTVGEILDRTANLYKSRFLVFFGIAAVPAAVVLGFGGLMVVLIAWAGTAGPAAGIAVGLGVLALVLLALPLMIGANALSGAALCGAASDLSLGGTITISSAFKAVWKRGWLYVGLYLLLMLILLAAPFAVWIVLTMIVGLISVLSGANAGVVSGAIMLLSFVGVLVYFVWMLVRVCLAFPIAVVEKAGVGAALKRGWELSEGTRWRIVVLFLLGLALSWVASLVLIVPVFLVVAMIPALKSAQNQQVVGTITLIATYGSSFLVQALTMPVYAIALVLFYYDQRVRREGFDIEMLMHQAGMAFAPPVAAVPEAEAPPWMPHSLHVTPAADNAASDWLPAATAVENATEQQIPDEVPAEAAADMSGEDTNTPSPAAETAPDAMGEGL
ncbi:MAG TPA: hypothetical protein VGJ21_06805 [Terracidiphilus sp.]|jgi:hypothetical protein